MIPSRAADLPVPTGNTYPKYATRNVAERVIVEGFLRRLNGMLPRDPPGVIFEIGVGEGEIAARLRARYPQARLYGLDLPDPGLADHWRTRRLEAVFADAHRLPVRDGSCDLVLAIEVLEHLADPTVALAEIARVARDTVVLSVPHEPLWRIGNLLRSRYVSALGNTPGHVGHWGRREFVRLVSDFLEVVAVSSPVPWTMVAARPR